MRRYRFGESTLTLTSRDETWLGYLHERYHPFEQESVDNEFRIDFDCTAPDLPRGMTSPLAAYAEAPRIENDIDGFVVQTATTWADVDLKRRRATLSGPRAAYPLDNLLRHLLPALGEQGAVFHAAALTTGDRGVLACGPSGAGKSTLARLASEHALCDELCAARLTDDGERLSSLPFWRARPGVTTLRAALLLRHGNRHHVERLTSHDALKRLSRQLLWPVHLPHAMDRVLGQLSDLVERVPVYELAFAPEPDVWSFIEENVLS